jgi:putative aldouronate transport system permease protein
MKHLNLVDRLFVISTYTILGLLTVGTLLPLLQVITLSVSPPRVINSYGFHVIPLEFDFSAYNNVFKYQLLWIAYGNTMIRTLVGTCLTVALTFLAAYPLSRKSLPNRSLWTGFIVLTMFFSGGLIPTYLLIKSLGLMDSMGALVLPSAVSVFMVLIVRNFVSALPESLEESAKMDGANEMYILWHIVIPLSLPIITTVGLYSAVWHWNAWFDSMIYMQTENKQVLQHLLRKILIEGSDSASEMSGSAATTYVNVDALKMATLVVSIIPLISVYPFLQKYFIKGSLMGSVKG